MNRRALYLSLGICCLALISRAESAPPADPRTVLLVVGAGGEPDFGTNFVQQATRWAAACRLAGCQYHTIGVDPVADTTDRELLQQALAAEADKGSDQLWIVLMGHGTFDGKEAKFNLRGPDVSGSDLAGWLQPVRRPVGVISTASASAPFMLKLSGTNRIVITATRSGYEQNYARLGTYFAEAIADPSADLDQDGQTSLLEAFLTASHRTVEFYQTDGRLATEHALIDDNGDGRGTPADWFRGVHAVKKVADGTALDGMRAHQWYLVRSGEEQKLAPAVRARRDELELSVGRLREAKARMPEDAYYRELEVLLVELARLYEDQIH